MNPGRPFWFPSTHHSVSSLCGLQYCRSLTSTSIPRDHWRGLGAPNRIQTSSFSKVMPRDTRRGCQPSLSPYDSRTNWTEETFINSDEAEAALCEDRSRFILRNDIMAMIPGNIKKCMIHSDVNAHIQGFQGLFVHLNKGRPLKRLRDLVEAYFSDCPPLSGHLSQSLHIVLR